MSKNWLLVIFAGLLEVIWAMGLKYASTSIEWFLTIIVIILSFYIFFQATKKIPVATAYAVFTGMGTAGTVIIETLFFGIPFSWANVAFILLLLCGVVGLKMVTEPEKDGVY